MAHRISLLRVELICGAFMATIAHAEVPRHQDSVDRILTDRYAELSTHSQLREAEQLLDTVRGPDREALFKAISDVYQRRDDGKGDPRHKKFIRRYLSEYPDGNEVLVFRWRQVFWDTHWYEYPEDDAQPAIDVATRYEEFLRDNPEARSLEHVNESIGRAWYSAALITWQHPTKNTGDAATFARNARPYWDYLLTIPDGRWHRDATSILEHLRQGLRGKIKPRDIGPRPEWSCRGLERS